MGASPKMGRGFERGKGFLVETPCGPASVYNHLAFTVKIHKPEGLPGWRIVGFEVVPYSVDSESVDKSCVTGRARMEINIGAFFLSICLHFKNEGFFHAL